MFEKQFDKSKLIKLVLLWYYIDVAIAFLIGISSGKWNIFIYLTVWFIIIKLLSGKDLKPYVMIALLLAILEETIVYFLGGGLGGTARSLIDDYAGSLPVFFMFILGWYLVMKRHDYKVNKVFLFSGLHGFLIEVVFTGAIFNPLSTLFIGGASIFIYGSIICTPKLPNRGDRNLGDLGYFVWFIIILVLIIIGGIIASNLRQLI